ncbi:MAG: hypothetical protein AVDCRST_MAG45-108 [uncultured Solirubrobacterales bacterium]|uniref:Uncharacterized protein n=1 Tax=uncultured Solirubrobacterales bacterium TaxID=768556 RepID=A0A6J4RRY1_9ACTN|nr:MAG: hypothetical protein AVDCRST_MAG45-108 [uncultured Solirubrobacterales bacterium]
MVDSELAPLRFQARLRCARVAVNLLRVPRVGLQEHEFAHVVHERSGADDVAIGVNLACDAVSGPLDSDRMNAEVLGRRTPNGGALEEIEHVDSLGERLDGHGAEYLDCVPKACHLSFMQAWPLVSQAQDGDRERGVGLDRATMPPIDGCGSPARRSRRSRDSVKAGNTSSASSARVSSCPWPSPRGRLEATLVGSFPLPVAASICRCLSSRRCPQLGLLRIAVSLYDICPGRSAAPAGGR